MTISFVGAANAAATSLTLPTHQAGDLIIIAAFTSGGTQPTTDPVVIPPSDEPGIAVGYTVTRDGDGSLAPATTVNFQLIDGGGVAANWLKKDKFSIVSDGDAEVVGDFVRGGRYFAWRNNVKRKTMFTVPDEATFELPEIVD